MSSINALSIEDINAFIDGGPISVSASRKERHFRYYNIIAKKDDSTLIFEQVIAQQASRIRKRMKELGYLVDMTDIESVDLSFRKTLSDDLDKFNPVTGRVDREPGCVPEYVSIKNHNWHQMMANKIRTVGTDKDNRANARNFIETENAKTRIYEKISGELKFVGSLDDGIDFIQSKINSGEWNQLNWVIYLPNGVYQEVMKENENGASR